MKRLLLVLLTILTVICFVAGCDQQTQPKDTLPASTEEVTGPYQFKSSELANYTIVYSGDNPDYFDLRTG